MFTKINSYLLLLLFVLGMTACVSVKVEPIKIEMDVTLRIEKELDDFFGDLEAEAQNLAKKDVAELKKMEN